MRDNRHAAIRRHKLRQKRLYGIHYGGRYAENPKVFEEKKREETENDRRMYRRCHPHESGYRPPNGGYEYWKEFYLTGPRKYAKSCTNDVIRAKYRDLLNSLNLEDLENIQALRGSDYEKLFDFWWTLY